MWIAQIEKFRVPNKAYAKPLYAGVKPRWHTIYQNKKGRFIVLRSNRVYEENWRYNVEGEINRTDR